MSRSGPVTLVTGASSGLGAALAREFASHGHTLVLTARREARLAALADEIAAAGPARPEIIAADMAAPEGTQRLGDALHARGLEPAWVVNVAGFGLLGAADEASPDRQLAMIDLNIRAVTDLTLRFLDSVTRAQGGILNVASIAGFMPAPGMAVYHASKAYIISFTEALHGELRHSGVRVCALCPGPVETEFFDTAGMPHNYFPGYLTRPVEEVAREGYAGLMRGRRVVVPGRYNRVVALLPRLLPRSFVVSGGVRRWQRKRPRRGPVRDA
jgi:short-subunit dehydrogenase